MRKIIFLVMLTTCLPAIADWTEITQMDAEAGTIYIDALTITKTVGNFRRAWYMGDYKERDSDGALSYVALFEFDCTEGKVRRIQHVTFSGHLGNGESVRSFDESPAWFYLPPGLTVDRVLNFVCAQKLGN